MKTVSQAKEYTPEQLVGLTEDTARSLGLPVSKELEAAVEQMIKLLSMLIEIDTNIKVYVERNVREGRA